MLMLAPPCKPKLANQRPVCQFSEHPSSRRTKAFVRLSRWNVLGLLFRRPIYIYLLEDGKKI
jgi:hypothetical protein